jgi:hypothetical protein
MCVQPPSSRQLERPLAGASPLPPRVHKHKGKHASSGTVSESMLDFYERNWLPYGQLLTDIEQRGIWLDRERLGACMCSDRSDVSAYMALCVMCVCDGRVCALASLTPVAWNDRDEAQRRFKQVRGILCGVPCLNVIVHTRAHSGRCNTALASST